MYLITEYLGSSLRVIVTQVLGKYMIIWYLDPEDIIDCVTLVYYLAIIPQESIYGLAGSFTVG